MGRDRREQVGACKSALQSIADRDHPVGVEASRSHYGYMLTHFADNGLDPLGHGSTVWMQDLDPAKPLRHAMHIDVSVPRGQAVARMEAAVAAGGRIVDDSGAPGTWILSDRAGNKVCIASWPDRVPSGEA